MHFCTENYCCCKMKVLVLMALVQTYATENALIKSNIIRNTPGKLSRKNLVDEVNPTNHPNLTHNDWSFGVEHYTETQDVNNFLWWATVNDYHTIVTDPRQISLTTHKVSEINPDLVTKSVTESSIDKKKVENQDETKQVENNTARLNNLDVTQMDKSRSNSAKYFNLNSIDGEGVFKGGDSNSYLNRIKFNAMKRNKQIQKMFDEISPDYVKTTTKATTVNKFDVIAKMYRQNQNHDLNISMNKVIESLNSNIGEKKVEKSFILRGVMESKENPTFPSFEYRSETTTEISNPIDSEDMQIGMAYDEFPEMNPLQSSTRANIRNDEITTMRTTEPAQLVKYQKSTPRTDYFSVFVTWCARIIGEKPDNDVWMLALSLEREYHVLSHKNKYIHGFGQTFLNALQSFATSFLKFPPDYLKQRAKDFNDIMRHRQKHHEHAELFGIIDYIDTLFEQNEGQALFKSLKLLKNYPNTTESSFEVVRATSDAVFAPYRRLSLKPKSTKREILIESINSYLRKLDLRFDVPSDNETKIEHLNSTGQNRRTLNNKTRFVIVSRDNKKKWMVELNKNMRTKKNTKRYGNCFGRSCLDDEKTKNKYVNKVAHTNKSKDMTNASKTIKRIKVVSKKQALTRFRMTTNYPTTRKKEHTKDGFKEKHPKIYKYIQLRRKIHKTLKQLEKLKQFKKRFRGKHKAFVEKNGPKEYSGIKAGNVKDKVLDNLSKINDVNFSYESDYSTDDSAVSAANSTSGIKSSEPKTSVSSNRNNSIIAKTLNKPIKNNLTVRNQIQYLNSIIKSVQTVEINMNNVTKEKPVKAISNIKQSKNANKLSKNKIKTIPRDINVYKTIKKYVTINEKRTTEPTKRNTSAIKNKITDLTSYSDEEETLKFKISDALRHDNEYFKPVRRSYHVPNKLRKGFNQFSSYSSEEVILKSNIYKTLGFEEFNTPIKAMPRSYNDKFKAEKNEASKY